MGRRDHYRNIPIAAPARIVARAITVDDTREIMLSEGSEERRGGTRSFTNSRVVGASEGVELGEVVGDGLVSSPTLYVKDMIL